uniref:Uncharacterized protein n=1 Tax=Rhizophora mucronata TaxID=61149 RepID=A0A2P2IZG5_RHIMU
MKMSTNVIVPCSKGLCQAIQCFLQFIHLLFTKPSSCLTNTFFSRGPLRKNDFTSI